MGTTIIVIISALSLIVAAYSLFLNRKTRKIVKELNKYMPVAPIIAMGEMNDNYLVDFSSDRFAGTISMEGGGVSIGGEGGGNGKNKTVKVNVKPIDVLKELETIPTNWSLEGLGDKISILKDKEKLIQQRYAKREVSGLIECLENRKHYEDTYDDKTYREYFSKYDATNDQKINKLLEKYDLIKESPDIFIPEFPEEAINIMKEVTEVVQKLCKKKPRFYVIASSKDFKKAYGKRDPILLVQSPFGFFYYILGAWDKEMLYLPEL